MAARWLLPIALTFACAGESGTPNATGTEGTAGTSTDGGSESSTGEPIPQDPIYALVYDASAETIQLVADDVPLLRFAVAGLQVAVADQVEDGLSYNPMFDLDVLWHSPGSVEIVDGGVLSLRLHYPAAIDAVLRFDEEAPGRFSATWVPELTSPPFIVAYRMIARVDPTEGLYGLGEWFDHPNSRGHVRPMQIEPDLSFAGGTNEAHVPIPFVTGTTGWGWFIEDPHPGRFDCASDKADEVIAEFGVGPDGPDGLRFHLYAAEHPLDVTKHYYDTTGYPTPPSPWAIGPWIWRNENDDQAQVISDANMLRDLDLPASALWIDRPYATGVNTFDFSAEKFTDAQAMIDELHALGLRVALWHTPYASDDAEPAPEQHDYAMAMGYYPPKIGVVLFNWGAPIDLTNPDAYDWWQSNIGEYADMGIEGYKLDFTEEIAGLGPGRVAWEFADGSTDRTQQSRFQLLYHRVYAEMLPPDGGFILARAGTYGDQVYGRVIWPGDIDANLGHFGDLVEGKAVPGGLSSAVAAGSSLGPSGYPLFASDTGGYRDAPPNKETFTRWFQHTALTPIMQIGTASNDVAWETNAENGFDEEMLGWYRDFTRLHLRLFPYLWTHVQRVQSDGRPIVRAYGLAYPEQGRHPPFEYLLGDDLLVAPVVDAGATTRELVVPDGSWLDWFTGEELVGPGVTTVDAPLSKLPLFLREGAIVPMLRPTIDSLSPTTEPDRVDSYATDPGVLYVRARPGEPSSFEVFDGTRLQQGQSDLTWAFQSEGGSVFVDGVLVEALGFGPRPASVEVDGSPLAAGVVTELGGAAWSYTDDFGGTLRLRIPGPGLHTVAARR